LFIFVSYIILNLNGMHVLCIQHMYYDLNNIFVHKVTLLNARELITSAYCGITWNSEQKMSLYCFSFIHSWMWSVWTHNVSQIWCPLDFYADKIIIWIALICMFAPSNILAKTYFFANSVIQLNNQNVTESNPVDVNFKLFQDVIS
jgi:hypothetical protein